jgi:acetylornithine/succinyldiaminopimelate/putrescine aminotransferase/predicted amino acid dehydrogenase
VSGRSIENFIRWLNTYNPTRSYLLDQFKLDKQMVRAHAHWMWDASGTRYLDFLSQYGVVSLGHSHPELKRVLCGALDEDLPAFGQPMIPVAAQQLADRLRDITPGDLAHTVFTNSGAEAVEAAFKLARARTGRRVILSASNAFHGKTLGALSATHKTEYQQPFGAPVPGFEMVPFGDVDALDARLRSSADVAAFIVEPIQGEGGIMVPPDGYLATARALCHQHGALFIVDEIQTGLGRTGAMFGLPPGVGTPDILLLAKALGGGLMPIGACIATQKAWDHEFGYRHSSTFAGNNLACRVGLGVLDLLERDDRALIRTVEQRGQYLRQRLDALRQRYPDVIREVRGRGLLVGLELAPINTNASGTMAYFASSDYLIAALCGYLMNRHGLITAPVFNNSRVLRLEPPFTVGEPEIDQAVAALDVLCDAIDRHDYAEVLGYLTGVPAPATVRTTQRFRPANPPNPPAPAGTRHTARFAFLMHYTSDQDILVNDNSFVQWSAEEFEGWKRFTNDSEAHMVYELPHMASATGASIDGFLLGFPMLPQQMMQRGRRKMLPLLRDAVTRAKKRGAQVLGLGGFTSIISRGGELLTGDGIAITSGSCLTAVMIRDAVHDLLGRVDLRAADLRLAVVGAAGAIGRLTSLMLAPEFGAVTLIGSGASVDGETRTHAVAGEIYATLNRETPLGSSLARLARERRIAAADDAEQHSRIVMAACQRAGVPPPVLVTTDAASVLRDADVIVCATSASSAFIESAHIKPGAIVIDAARPQNVSPAVLDRRDILVVEGGLVELPQPIHFGPNVQGFQPGINLACLAETMLLAVEGNPTDHGIGQTSPLEEALRVAALADRHGFRLAPPHRGTVPLPASVIDRFAASVRVNQHVDVV